MNDHVAVFNCYLLTIYKFNFIQSMLNYNYSIRNRKTGKWENGKIGKQENKKCDIRKF